jgi:hypothetical protein
MSSISSIESMTDTISNVIDNKEPLYTPNEMLRVYPEDKLIAIDKVDPSNMRAEIKATRISDVESWILATPTVVLKKRKREVTDSEPESKDDLIDIPLEIDSSNETMLFKREIIKPEQQPPVYVHIQNITEVCSYLSLNKTL